MPKVTGSTKKERERQLEVIGDLVGEIQNLNSRIEDLEDSIRGLGELPRVIDYLASQLHLSYLSADRTNPILTPRNK